MITWYLKHFPLQKGKTFLRDWSAYLAWKLSNNPYRTIKLDTGIFHLDLREFNQRQIYFFENYEQSVTKYLDGVINKNTVFFDVGANIGWYTLLACSKGAIVHSFEPDKNTFKNLQTNVTLNNYLVNLYNVGLSSNNGAKTFYQCAKNFNPLKPNTQGNNQGGNSFILNNQQHKNSLPVLVRTLDSYNFYYPKKEIIIKIDTEGSELYVLEGMKNFLEKHKCISILVESTTIESKNKLSKYLQNYGIVLVGTYPKEDILLYRGTKCALE